jgi:nucleotide-binding universal stress UspA family protein
MRILVAVDGSSSSEAVIQEAARRPWPAGSEFNMVTVVDPFFFTRAPLLLEEAKKNTMQSLEDQAKPLAEAGWQVSTNVILDNPRHALPRAGKAWKADLILLGSHGRGAVGRLLLGSTAQAVLRHAECSVEIVRRGSRQEGSGEGMRVLAPTDGSECADAALRSVAGRPWPKGAEFKVIASPELPVVVGEYPFYPTEHMDQVMKSGQEHANESARSGEALLTKAGLKAGRWVADAQDSPAHAILAAADDWKADLIVMGSHGRRGFDRLILGSVSEAVALHARCSVEVVRMPLAVL